jgi:outer membrane lipoprotein SlyB
MKVKLKKLRQHATIALISAIVLGLAGCSAMDTAIKHRNLDVQTKMSKSVFLQPVPSNQKTVYIDVHNTSNQRLASVKPMIKDAVQQKGYKVVNYSKAHYLLQANVLQIGKMSKSAADDALTGGFGGAISGAVLGAATGAVVDGSNASIIGGGIVGGLVGSVANDMVSNTTYTMITDVQISAKLPKGAHARSTTTAAMEQGTATRQITRISGKTSWLKYRTRVVSTANKVNLSFASARAALMQQLSTSIANIF